MSTRKLYQVLASALNAIENCRATANAEGLDKHEQTVVDLVLEHMPSGGGFDNGTTLRFEKSKGGERLVFETQFHHMNEAGFYDGWTEHTVTIKPCLIHNFSLTVSGRDRNDIKDYISECFNSSLSETLQPDNTSGIWKRAA